MDFYKLDPFPSEAKELAVHIQDLIYEPVSPFTMKVWKTTEPVSFHCRMTGTPQTVGVGDRWATDLFDCGWFLFEADCPASDEELCARIDINGELCLVDDEGMPVRGLTSARSFFEPAFGSAGKLTFDIDRRQYGSPIRIWGDAGFNDLFGVVQDGGLIRQAGICRRRGDLRDLYYDLETLIDYFEAKRDRASERQQFLSALKDVRELVTSGTSEDIQMARTLLGRFRGVGPRNSRLNITALGHAHLDLAWLWPIRETYRKNARTFASALYNIERYPEYRYGCSQPQLFSWLKDSYPDLFTRVKQAVGNGKIEPLGSFWVEPDCNLPSGESLVRQILHGRRFFLKEFGYAPDFCWQPDVFGYNGQLPQILAKSGHKYFMTQKLSWNVVNRFPHQSFQWEGIDGSRILVHMLPEETYNSPAAPRTMIRIQEEYIQKDVSSHALVVFGIGDGGGGPDAEHLERLRRINDLAGIPLVKQQLAREFFPQWASEAPNFPTWKGELYLERHQGTFTTHAGIKACNRRCEALLFQVEFLAVWAQMEFGEPYAATEIESLWKEVLLYQFHDILPGSSIRRVYEDIKPRYQLLISRLEEMVARLRRIIDGEAATVFNTTSWPRSEWIKDGDKWHKVTVPALGYAPLSSEPTTATSRVGKGLMSNDFLSVKFGQDGTISSLFDRRTGAEFANPDGGMHQFLLFEDLGDAWDFETDHAAKDVWKYLERKPERAILLEQEEFMEGPIACVRQKLQIRDSLLEVLVELAPDSEVVTFTTRVDWREKGAMLRVQFPFLLKETTSRFEIPFGSVERSTKEEESRDRAQIEVPALQWALLADEERGVAVLNDSKHGYRMKGNVADLNILRSVPYPGKATIDATGHATVGKSDDFTDIEIHQTKYTLMPFTGAIDLAAVSAKARGLNQPLRPMRGGSMTMSKSRQLLNISDRRIELTALKQAEDGKAVVMRLANVTDANLECKVHFHLPFSAVEECDLVEEKNLGTDSVSLDHLSFGPFEIRTFRIQPL
jgi:alpha-mannosidase